jgi:hypothetical protein
MGRRKGGSNARGADSAAGLEPPTRVATAYINFYMTHEAHELLETALALPESERAELAGNLISSQVASHVPFSACRVEARTFPTSNGKPLSETWKRMR